MIKKLRNNNKGGADLQFATATFLFMFVVCVGLLLDFWYVSSAKIAILKAVQSTELYCLVSNAPKEGADAGNSPFEDKQNMLNVNLASQQMAAVLCTQVDLPNRLGDFPYLRDFNILSVLGVEPVGQMGVTVKMEYRVKTMIRTPGQIFNFMRPNGDPELTSTRRIPLTVTSKLVPMVTDKAVS